MRQFRQLQLVLRSLLSLFLNWQLPKTQNKPKNNISEKYIQLTLFVFVLFF